MVTAARFYQRNIQKVVEAAVCSQESPCAAAVEASCTFHRILLILSERCADSQVPLWEIRAVLYFTPP